MRVGGIVFRHAHNLVKAGAIPAPASGVIIDAL